MLLYAGMNGEQGTTKSKGKSKERKRKHISKLKDVSELNKQTQEAMRLEQERIKRRQQVRLKMLIASMHPGRSRLVDRGHACWSW